MYKIWRWFAGRKTNHMASEIQCLNGLYSTLRKHKSIIQLHMNETSFRLAYPKGINQDCSLGTKNNHYVPYSDDAILDRRDIDGEINDMFYSEL